MKHIICFHLFNDYSGSPTILKSILSGILNKGYQIDLISSSGGVLDDLQSYINLRKYSYNYTFSTNCAITIFRYSIVQIYIFLLSFRYLFKKNIVFYINTILPVGAALAGRIMGKKVVYHYHENSQIKGLFYKILCQCMQYFASEIICVSQYQRSFLKQKKNINVIPNALSTEFVNQLKPDHKAAFERKTVLMLSSLKEYKGTIEFIQLSQLLPQYRFILVINDIQENINNFIKQYHIIENYNLSIFSRQNNVSQFYNQASIVLNLSNKDLFIETFGLTALEAMSAGLPVIVPTEGGIAEMVEDGMNGYKIDVQELDKIANKICQILSNKPLYNQLSTNALQYSKRFNASNMTEQILQLITQN